ncbi:hypothetical protein [Anaerotignum sp.]|uniref:hypothetical protein n=1 Tax=Anaerotignum sp. TaxID=2039241 RepID=UPI00289AE112|nr:hypothetical protein [Anaerotignum sp.]
MLKRSYARAYIVLYYLVIVIFSITFFIERQSVLREILSWTLPVLWIAVLIIRLKYLRCPYCRKLTVEPQWSESGTQDCINCGKVFEYDK